MDKIKIELNELEIDYIIESLGTQILSLEKFVYDDNNFIEQINHIRQLRKELRETVEAFKRGDIWYGNVRRKK